MGWCEMWWETAIIDGVCSTYCASMYVMIGAHVSSSEGYGQAHLLEVEHVLKT